jgi:EAL domain-containing protein (putative c-di-GMP-specific phosphodiesterase class I)
MGMSADAGQGSVCMEGTTNLHAAIRGASDPMLVMDRIVHEALQIVPSAKGALVELAEGDSLTCVCGAGLLAEAVGMRMHRDDSLSGLSFQTGSTLRCDDSERDSRVHREAFRHTGSRSAICVPLRFGNEPVGVFTVTSAAVAAFDDRDVETLTGLAEFITAAITTSRELDRVAREFLSSVDPVTPDTLAREDGKMSTFVANVLHPGAAEDVESAERIERALTRREFTSLFQPIIDLRTGKLVGAEALTRFLAGPYRPPNVWFAEASRVGRGVQLEHAAAQRAIQYIDELPSDCFLSVNLGPEAIESEAFNQLFAGIDPRRVVIELTEQLPIEDYPRLRDTFMTIRERGVRLAIDDTGSGYSSLSHILKLAPDIIKIDQELIRGIDFDPVRQSLVEAVVTFAPRLGATVVGEGVETEAERDSLSELGVELGQGYFLGRPGPVEFLDARQGEAREDSSVALGSLTASSQPNPSTL